MNIIAIDPGTTESAVVRWDGESVSTAKILPNDHCLGFVRAQNSNVLVAVEMVACYGMPVGREVFETCLLVGRIQEAVFVNCLEGVEFRLIYRRDVKLHHCQSARAKDGNVRQALIDKYGAPGTLKAKGRTYGLKSHLWSAFAIATYVTENMTQTPQSERM